MTLKNWNSIWEKSHTALLTWSMDLSLNNLWDRWNASHDVESIEIVTIQWDNDPRGRLAEIQRMPAIPICFVQ